MLLSSLGLASRGYTEPEAGGCSAWGSALGDIPSQQDRKVAEGNQLFLRNLTFETSRNFSCKVMAPSVPGLEQSKRVAVAVEGKTQCVCRPVSARGSLSCPASTPFPPWPPHREAADCVHQLPAVRAAERRGEPDVQGHCFPQALCPLERQWHGESCLKPWSRRGCALLRALNPLLFPPCADS